MEIKRLYDEQQENFRTQLLRKDEELEGLRHDLEFRAHQLDDRTPGDNGKEEEIARLRGELDRLRGDAQAKILQLQERIKELNQKLVAAGKK
jgi:hypothetical protein